MVDSDGDGMLNGEEWIAGTDPTDAASYLKFDSIESSGWAVVTFATVAARTYRVEFMDRLGAGSWAALTNVVARSTTGV